MTARRKRDSSGHIDPFHQRRKRYRAILSIIGLHEAFAAMPRFTQEVFFRQKFPDASLEFLPAFPTDPALRNLLLCALHEATIGVSPALCNARDFLSIIPSMKRLIEDARGEPDLPPTVQHFFTTAYPLLSELYEKCMPNIFVALGQSIFGVLAAHSRIDTRVFTGAFTFPPTSNGKISPKFTLGCIPPQTIQLNIDGSRRPVYRVPCSVTIGGWVEWKTHPLTGAAFPKPLPVFAQSHALVQLRRRVDFPPAAPYVEVWLRDAVENPRVIERSGDDLLIEFRLKEHHVGYLVCTILPDLVLIRTFLFLTMQGTPESRKLRQNLSLMRADIDWLKLDQLNSFVSTDLATDPQLHALFADCGCAHLFSLRDSDCTPTYSNYAAEVRQYLRLAA